MKTKKLGTDSLRLLRKCIQFFEGLSDADLDRFLVGSLKLSLIDSAGESERRKDGTTGELFRENQEDVFHSLVERLRATDSREVALRLLQADNQTSDKNGLAHLARHLRIHITKHDTRDLIEDKIVESVIGVRLRSQAIQDVNLKGSTSTPVDPTLQEEEVGTYRGSGSVSGRHGLEDSRDRSHKSSTGREREKAKPPAGLRPNDTLQPTATESQDMGSKHPRGSG